MTDMEMDRNPEKFNFNKVDKSKEVVFSLEAAQEKEDDRKAKSMFLINVSPLEFGNCLLVHHMEDCLPQVL